MNFYNKPDRSRFAMPARDRSSSRHRPSMARRALLMDLANQIAPRSPSPPPPMRQSALLVANTPRGSLRVSGDSVAVDLARSPGGNLHVQAHTPPLPLSVDTLERIEAMDMSDEEVEETLEKAPWHIQRWLRHGGSKKIDVDEGGRECPAHKPLSPITTTEGLEGALVIANQPSNSQGGLEVTCVDADARPSTSGMGGEASKPVTERKDEGSDLDSEYDDEFDVLPIKVTAMHGLERDVPDDDDLEQPDREIIRVVENAMDEEADNLAGVSNIFDWSQDFDTFRGVPEVFSGPSPGAIKDYDEPYDAFMDIWNKDIMELIANETNRYANQTIEAMKGQGTLKQSSRLHQWHDTDVDEMARLFSLYIYMSIDVRSSQHEYWRTDNVLEMHKFKDLMSYNRYILLSKFLHFVDNTNLSQCYRHRVEAYSKKLAKLEPVITHLNSKFSSLYNLGREISIDESLTLFKGRLSFVQAIRSKAARFGIKSYELCESLSGYLYRFTIYAGKNSGISADDVTPSAELGGKTTQVVLGLLKGLERRGHCVTMDNFYNCPSLARYLKSLGFDCMGTLRVNRKHVPRDISIIPKNVTKGTIIARHSGDLSIVAWKDVKVVTMISTYHNAETYTGSKAGKVLVKPVCVQDYNKTMGGVDLKDQKLSMYLLERKRGLKWYVKMFKRLLNVSIHNAFVMYVNSLRRRNMNPVTHREFRYKLAQSLQSLHRSRLPQVSQMSQPVEELTRLRRDIMHVPKYHGSKSRKRCIICFRQDINKMVHLQCMTCDVFLCFEQCWIEWHSLSILKGQEKRGRKRTRNE